MTDNPSSSVPVSKGEEIARRYVHTPLSRPRLASEIDSALASQEARHQKDMLMLEDALDTIKARHRQEMEEAKRERDEALDFLRRAAYPSKEIVSTCRLTALNINIENYRRAGLMYVEPGGGLGWVVREATPVWWSGERAEQLEKRAEAAEQREREAGERETALREVLKALLSCREGGVVSCSCGAIENTRAAIAAIRHAPSPVSAPPCLVRGCEGHPASPVEPGSDPQ